MQLGEVADLKVLVRFLPSRDSGSKLGSAALSWKHRSAYISQKVVSVRALSNTCTPSDESYCYQTGFDGITCVDTPPELSMLLQHT